MPCTKLRISALPLGERPLLQEIPEVRHVGLDLLASRPLHLALRQLPGRILLNRPGFNGDSVH